MHRGADDQTTRERHEHCSSIARVRGNGCTDEAVDRGLGVALNVLQVCVADEAFGIDFVNALGARRARGKPAVCGLDANAAERRAAAFCSEVAGASMRA